MTQLNSPRRTLALTLLASVCAAIPFLATTSKAASPAPSPIPRIEELAGDWQNIAEVRSMPALASSQGAAEELRDPLAIGNAAFPPITMTGSSGSLLIDGKTPLLERTRWYPYQVLRAASAGNLDIETAVRLPFDQKGILYHVALTNNGSEPRSFELKILLSANTSRHASWGWGIPRDKNTNRFSAVVTDNGRTILFHDSSNQLANAIAFVHKPDDIAVHGSGADAVWRVSLAPKSGVVVNYALAIGEKEENVHALASAGAGLFDLEFSGVQSEWQRCFSAMFVPGNGTFSGNLPTLVTSDEKLRRMYYMSALTILCSYRTCFPVAPRVYVTASPQSCGTLMYFWDTAEWATSLALLDPVMLKQYLHDWLKLGIYDGYAEEYQSGELKGPWYSANDLSVFRLLDAYLDVTGDRAFLAEKAGDKTVLEHMDAIATHWKSLVRPGRTLADYGGKANLLECVPTYVNEVASFNAANIWMMRRVAALQEAAGNKKRAEELRSEVARLLPAVMALYEPGQGVWDALHRDGSRVEVRHVYDFSTVGLSISDDLTPKMRDEMTAFVERELLVDHWMRAQSLSDPAASQSDRPDHGPMGAYCAWPAETISTLCRFGKFDLALDFLRRCAEVTHEGPFSQSRELMGKTHDAAVRIAERGPHGPSQTFNACNGGSFDDVIIREFFGYQPDLFKEALAPETRSRGFDGQLLNLRHADKLVNIASTPRGLQIAPAK